jgi:hypothetical protein
MLKFLLAVVAVALILGLFFYNVPFRKKPKPPTDP